MDHFVAISVVFMIFVALPGIIFNYLAKTRSSNMLTREDERMLADLWQMAKKMEDRIQSLETILNSQTPGWRKP